MSIPIRVWYDKGEIAQLTGQSVATINRRIREGRGAYPGPDAIRPEQTRQFGDRLKVHCSYLTGEPLNVTPLRQPALTPEQIDDIVRRAVHATFAEIGRAHDRMVG